MWTMLIFVMMNGSIVTNKIEGFRSLEKCIAQAKRVSEITGGKVGDYYGLGCEIICVETGK